MKFIRTPEEFEAMKAQLELELGDYNGYLRHYGQPNSYPALVEPVFSDYNDHPMWDYYCYPMNDPAILAALKHIYLTDVESLRK
jgi:hypothetical protein